ncbi:hypothetical protein MKZ38_009720 [Zalerion maritima]|uniref:Uncharacterized protein n=1 Tax=Zalerion maritima TaxID=339359 RepID=A0AAD5RSZ0_9PEZI|nr:hypothetical protein MKZ38_009720 [Zalerion maritima]
MEELVDFDAPGGDNEHQHQLQFLRETATVSSKSVFHVDLKSDGSVQQHVSSVGCSNLANCFSAEFDDCRATLRLLRVSRTFGPGELHPLLQLPESTFDRVFQAMGAGMAVKYLVLNDYDGFHHETTGRVSTFYLAAGVASLVWTFDRETLATRAMYISRGWDEGQYRKPGRIKGSRPAHYLSSFLRAFEKFQKHICSPYFLAIVTGMAMSTTFDRDTAIDLQEIRQIEVDTQTGAFDTRSMRRDVKMGIDYMTLSIQLAGIAASGAFNRSRHAGNLDEALQFAACEMAAANTSSVPESMKELYLGSRSSLLDVIKVLRKRIGGFRSYASYFRDRSERLSQFLLALLTHEDAVSNYQVAEAAKRDSSSMKTVAIMTMAFLPATFFSSLFAMPSLKWDKPGDVVGNGFSLYWAFSISFTVMIFILWGYVTNRRWISEKLKGKC